LARVCASVSALTAAGAAAVEFSVAAAGPALNSAQARATDNNRRDGSMSDLVGGRDAVSLDGKTRKRISNLARRLGGNSRHGQ